MNTYNIFLTDDETRRWPKDIPENQKGDSVENFHSYFNSLKGNRQCLLLLHGNNNDLVTEDSELLGKLKKGLSLLLQNRGKLIIFSGGQHIQSLQLLQSFLYPAYKEGEDFIILHLKTPNVFLRGIDLSSGNIAEADVYKIFRSAHGDNYSAEMTAFKILINCYLMVWAPREILKQNSFMMHDRIEGAKTKYGFESPESALLFIPEKNENESFWFDPLIRVKDKTFNEIVKVYEKWQHAYRIEKAWGLICNHIQAKDRPEVIDNMFNIFLSAYWEIKALEFEELRSRLNHDEVKNKFINKIASARSDTEISLRAKNIKEVWDVLRDGISVEDLSAKERTVRQGLENWKSVYESLRHYFENAIKKHGFKGTDIFEVVKKDFFDGDNSKTAIINRFVADFDRIAMQSDIEREERLKEFFSAIDAIHTTLSDMRYSDQDNSHFYKYFKEA